MKANLTRQFYLTQRLTMRNGTGKFQMDYMGSSEFEYGAPQNSFKKLASLATQDKLSRKDVHVVMDPFHITLAVIYDSSIYMPSELDLSGVSLKESLIFGNFVNQAWVPCTLNFNKKDNVEDQPGIILMRDDSVCFQALDSLLRYWSKDAKSCLDERFSSATLG